MNNMWCIVATICDDCGGRQAVRIFNHEPTSEEINETKESAGGNDCMVTFIHKIWGFGMTSVKDKK